jgi:hypothetical protein
MREHVLEFQCEMLLAFSQTGVRRPPLTAALQLPDHGALAGTG